LPNRPWHTSNAEFARSPPPRPVRRNRNVLSLPIWCSPHVRSSRCWKEEEDRLRRDSAFMILKDRMSIPRRWQLRSCYNRRRDNDRRAGGWDINARSMDNVVAPPKARSRNGKQIVPTKPVPKTKAKPVAPTKPKVKAVPIATPTKAFVAAAKSPASEAKTTANPTRLAGPGLRCLANHQLRRSATGRLYCAICDR
jgi:hypothetical protein